jgi:hypothetical protein
MAYYCFVLLPHEGHTHYLPSVLQRNGISEGDGAIAAGTRHLHWRDNCLEFQTGGQSACHQVLVVCLGNLDADFQLQHLQGWLE